MLKNKLKCLIGAMLVSLPLSLWAQNLNISGRVTDNNGDTLPGVNVVVKGTTIGTITNIDGDYSISAPANATLVFTMIGMTTIEVAVGNRTTITVVMQEDSEVLDEVVVVGYGTQRKASLTSAISQIKGDDAYKDKGVNNAVSALQGTVPGLQITRTSTRPGSEGLAMKIRGDISMNGNSEPLVLIDGMSASLAEFGSMDPNDIENVSVLKDASAAIYGARSAAGVVLVTTKRGKAGKTRVSYSGSVTTSINGITPDYTTMTEWLDMFWESQYQDARAKHPEMTSFEDVYATMQNNASSGGWWIMNKGPLTGTDADGNLYNNEKMWLALRNGETLTLTNDSKWKVRIEPGHNIMEALYGATTNTQHTASVNGGNEKFGYMASLGYARNQSQLKVARDGEEKYSARMNTDFQATKLLKIETGMAYEIRNITTPSTDVNGGWEDIWFWPFYNQAGNFMDIFSGKRNVVGGLIAGGHIKTDRSTFRGTAKATIDLGDLVKGLSVYGTGGYKKTQIATQTLKNLVQYYDWDNNPTGNRQGPGSLTEQRQAYTNITLGAFANYDNTFADAHHVTAMIGITGEEEAYNNITASRSQGPIYPISSDNPGAALVDLNAMVSGTNNGAGGGQSEWAFLSYLTRLNYAYKNKYLVEFLGRRDGSSKLSKEQRWKNFYSVSGGWVISRESFMENQTWLNNLKVRYNYGKTGSVQGIGNYDSYSTLKQDSYFFGTSLASQAAITLNMTSSLRTWETINSHDVGVDFAVLDSRLSGTFDWFKKINEGMFVSVAYPAVLGTSAPSTNAGKFDSKGWEFSLSWRDRIEDFTYSVGAYISDAKSILAEWPDNANVPAKGKNSNRLVGMPRDAIYVWNTGAIFQTQAEADAYYDKYYWVDPSDHSKGAKPNNIIPAPATSGTNRLRPGARSVIDANKDGAITNDDLVYAGDAAPHYLFGFNMGLEWKGFDLKTFFQGVGKQVVLRTGQQYAPMISMSQLQNATFCGKFWSDIDVPSLIDGVPYSSPANTTTTQTIASVDANFNKWNYENKDVSVQNSRYIRLKSLVIGYTLPKSLTQKLKIDRLRFYFSGDDLWELTSITDGFDPENGEASRTTYPFARMLSVGLELVF